MQLNNNSVPSVYDESFSQCKWKLQNGQINSLDNDPIACFRLIFKKFYHYLALVSTLPAYFTVVS